jgi:hypothetical protein
MARLRTVKPEFWTDERVGEVSVTARLLFIATWNFADDYGGVDRSAKQLKAQAFPYDNIDCEPLIQELLQVGLLIEYEVGGKKYLHINGFRKHQKVEKPAKPRIPLYEHSTSPPRVLPESSPTSSGSSLGIGVESSGVESTRGEGVVADALAEMSQAGAMASALRQRDVTVTSMHPTLIGWIQSGFSVSQVCEAVEVARKTKQTGSIPANYLDRILREPARPPPLTGASRSTWRPAPDESETGCIPPNSTPSSKH